MSTEFGPFSLDCSRSAGAQKPGTWKRPVPSKLISVHSRASGDMLSPHEFATLMLVAAAPGQIDLNRDERSTHCWTVSSSPGTAVLELDPQERTHILLNRRRCRNGQT